MIEKIHCKGVTRSWTIDFKVGRRCQNEKREKARESIDERYKWLILEMEQSKGQTSNLPILSSLTAVVKKQTMNDKNKNEKIDLEKIVSCEICPTMFSSRKSKLTCPTCRRAVCSNCKNSKYTLPLPPTLLGTLEICKKCEATSLKKARIESFRKKLNKGKEHPVNLWYTSLTLTKLDIEKIMPSFRGIVQTLTGRTLSNIDEEDIPAPFDMIRRIDRDTLYYLQFQATEQLRSLELNFKNFQNQLKKITTSPSLNQREDTLKKYIRMGNVAFLQLNLPQFNFLSEQLIYFLNSPEMMAALKSYELAKLEQHKQEEEQPQQPQLEDRKNGTVSNGSSVKPTHSPSSSSSSTPRPLPFIPEKQHSKVSKDGSQSYRQGSERIGSNDGSSNHINTKARLNSLSVKSNQPKESSFLDIFSFKTSREDDIPTIVKVKPSIVHINGGTMILIQGENLKDGLHVIIGGVRISPNNIKFVPIPSSPESKSRSTAQIEFKSPKMTSEGLKSIILINPDAKTAILENVLTYVDDDMWQIIFKGEKQKKY